MLRRTITLNDAIYNELQKIRAASLELGREMSFTTIVNIVLLGGILGADRFDAHTWREILAFIEEESPTLEFEALHDQYVEKMVKKRLNPNL